MHEFFYIKFEIYLLFTVCYIIFLYILHNFLKFKLTVLDFIFISILFLILLLQSALDIDDLDGIFNVYILNNFIVYNNIIKLFKLFMTLYFFIYLIVIFNFNSIIKIPIVEYLILIFLCFFSLVMMIVSNHLFVIFLFLELLNICLYCLIGLNKNSNKGIEAAFKYFMQSAVVTISGFFFISLIYLLTGTLFLNELINIIISLDFYSYVIIHFIMCGLISVIFFKLGLFPLHSWIPEVYQGSYLIVALFIGTLPKIAYIFLFLKLYAVLPNTWIVIFCLIISLLTVFYGTIISLYQVSFKRLLAYGSMVHMGFLIYALTLNTPASISAAIFYLLVYVLLMMFIFSFMCFFFEDNNNGLFFLDDISRLGIILNKNYLLSLCFAFILLSLAGLPIFVGFISKWYIFINLLYQNQFVDLGFLLLTSILSAAYYIRIIRFSFFVSTKDSKSSFFTGINLSKSFFLFIIFLFILNILVIYYHNWIYLYIFKCVLCLFYK